MSVKEEIILDFMPDGSVVCNWWTKKLQELINRLGFKDAPKYEQVNSNPWCG